jgi:hypothetical protein
VSHIYQILQELGTDPATMSAKLVELGIKGKRGSPTHNPIAHYLWRFDIKGYISVSQVNIRAEGQLLPTPDHISEFIRLFDKGELTWMLES